MLATISPIAVAAHLHSVQSGLQLLYQSAAAVRRMPSCFHPAEVEEMQRLLRRGVIELSCCEQLLSGIGAANDGPAHPALA